MTPPRRFRLGFLDAPIIPWIFFLAVSAIFLGDALFSGGAYLLRDVLTFHHPWQSAIRDAVHAGRLPLWNHLSGCGMPLLANLQSGFFYPLHWLAWVLPFDRALTIEMVLHLTLAGALMHRFLRRTGIGLAGSYLGGIGFAYGTWTIGYLEFPMKLGSAVWLPLLWTGIWDAMRHGSRRGVAWAAVAVALSIFAGYPQLVFLQLVSAAILALVLLPGVLASGVGFGAKLHRLGAFPFAVLVAFLIGGAQLLPAREMTELSTRAADYPPDVAMSRSLPPHGLAGFVDPFFLGLPGIDRYWGGSLVDFAFGAFYVGILGLPLAIAASGGASARLRELLDVKGRRRQRLERKAREVSRATGENLPRPGTMAADPDDGFLRLFLFLTIGLAVAVILSLGKYTPVYAILLEFVPGFAKMRWPSTAGFLIAAHLSALAGAGLHAAFRRGTTPGLLPKALVVLGGVLLAVGLLGRGPLAPVLRAIQTSEALQPQLAAYDAMRDTWLTTVLVRGAMLLLAGTTAIFLARRAKVVAGFWIAIVAMDLFLVVRSIDMPVARGFYDHVPDTVAALREELGGRRVFTPRSTDQLGNFLSGLRNPVAFEWGKRAMLCNANIPAHVAQAQGCDPLSPRRHDAFTQALEMPTVPWEVKERVCDLWDASMLLTVEGMAPPEVARLASDARGLTTARHEPRLGRATLLNGWETVATVSGEEMLGRLFAPQHDPLAITLVEVPEGTRAPAEPARMPVGPGEPLPVHYERGQIHVAWQMGRAGMLRVLESWAPGWRATVNGAEAPVLRADFLFMGVPVPEGPCEVVLSYEPTSLRDGAIASALGLAALAFLFAGGGVKSARTTTGRRPAR